MAIIRWCRIRWYRIRWIFLNGKVVDDIGLDDIGLELDETHLSKLDDIGIWVCRWYN